MRQASINDYQGVAKDAQENFHGNQLVYIGWDKHLIFCAPICVPLPPDAPFEVIVKEILPAAYGLHPDFEHIDWSHVEWTVDQISHIPDMHKSLSQNGVGHKSVIRFVTPGLNGIGGVAA
ncbi:phenol hydroxylase [Pseudomaricurvus alkylphenolicus]|uniref:phenol hydroxylase subunit P4 n=1 Tax=Pseudomaricurvus alkylphenolicus TaxID=1306991 RepID=UPI00141FEB0C|nr:phenol hydroxylase subunit P4 [Pseudomaricurvus alkylphenolicus]NIB42232.1 phenol hydroxylase [Pseudomaricurvus alkylphenolicus]